MFSCGFPTSNRFKRKLSQLSSEEYNTFDMSVRAAMLQPERYMSSIFPMLYEKDGSSCLVFVADITGATITMVFRETGYAGLFDFCLDAAVEAEAVTHIGSQ